MRSYKRGNLVFQDGDHADELLIVMTGVLAVHQAVKVLYVANLDTLLFSPYGSVLSLVLVFLPLV